MTRRKARRFGGMVLLWLIAMGIIVRVLPNDVEMRRGYVLGYALACALALYAISMIHQHVLPQIRKMPMYVAVGVTALLYMGAIVLSSALGIGIMEGFVTRSWASVLRGLVPFFAKGWEFTLGLPFLVALGILFLVELSRRIGPGRVISLLLGRYRNPREETRIFLLVDICGSTPLAERLGSVRYSTLLRDFFDDLTEPVLDTDGEVVEYVGDEAVLSWPFRNGENCVAALRCYLLIKKRMEAKSAEYMKNYGVVPSFKAAIHAGPVVATEVGQLKTQLVFHGDALNTASRVLGRCGELEAELLVTESVTPFLVAVKGFRIDSLGRVPLKGKWEPLELSRVADE